MKIRIADVHAEATSEKVALGWHLDGKVSMSPSAPTPTSPPPTRRVLPGGTAYITDVGMCGPYDSVLGRRKDRVLKHMTSNMPAPFDVATNDVKMCGLFAEVDESTGKATACERIEIAGGNSDQAYDADDKPGGGE